MRIRDAALLGILASPACVGPLIEISVHAVDTRFQTVFATAVFVFDAGAPPVGTEGTYVIFEGVRADVSLNCTLDNFSGVPKADVTHTTEDGSLPLPRIFADSVSNNYAIDFPLGSPVAAFLSFEDAHPSFSGAPASLPDDPAHYTQANYSFFQVFGATGWVEVIWSEKLGFLGGRHQVQARVIAPPPTEACSEVDLAEPFGVLDFADVLAFLTAFGAGCP